MKTKQIKKAIKDPLGLIPFLNKFRTALNQKQRLDQLQKFNYELVWKEKGILIVGYDTEFNAKKNEVYSVQLYFTDQNGFRRSLFIELENYKRPKLSDIVGLIQEYFPTQTIKKLYLMAHYNTAEVATIEDFKMLMDEDRFSHVLFGKFACYTWRGLYGISEIHIFDTMNYQKVKLSDIGESLGLNKIEINQLIDEKHNHRLKTKAIANFGTHLKHPECRDTCIKYAIRDAQICYWFTLAVMYIGFIECNQIKVKMTLPSLAEEIFIRQWRARGKTDAEIMAALGHLNNKQEENKHKVDHQDRWHKFKPMLEIVSAGLESYRGGRNQTYFNGIIKDSVLDLDLKSAYPQMMRLCQGLKIKVDPKTGVVIEILKKKNWTFKEFKRSVLQSPQQMVLKQGLFTGKITYKQSVKAPITLMKSNDRLIECRVQELVTGTLTELVALILHENDVEWEYTEIQSITEFETNGEFIFREYVDHMVSERSKYDKKDVFNLIYKLLANALYGKLAQGVDQEIIKDLKGKTERKPYSKITSLVHAAFICAGIRVMVAEACNSLNEKEYEIPMNIITDGILFSAPDKNKVGAPELVKKYIKRFNDQPYTRLIRELNELDNIWELKHYSKGGIIPKVRVDMPLKWEKAWETDDSTMKLAVHTALEYTKDKKAMFKLQKKLYLKSPTSIVKSKMLSSIKIQLSDGMLVHEVTHDKKIDWNYQTSKAIEKIYDDKHLKGITLKMFDNIQQALSNIEFCKKHQNEFIAYKKENMEKLLLKQNMRRSWNSTDENFIMRTYLEDILIKLVMSKRKPKDILYSDLPIRIKSFISSNNYRQLKIRIKRGDGKTIFNDIKKRQTNDYRALEQQILYAYNNRNKIKIKK